LLLNQLRHKTCPASLVTRAKSSAIIAKDCPAPVGISQENIHHTMRKVTDNLPQRDLPA